MISEYFYYPFYIYYSVCYLIPFICSISGVRRKKPSGKVTVEKSLVERKPGVF